MPSKNGRCGKKWYSDYCPFSEKDYWKVLEHERDYHGKQPPNKMKGSVKSVSDREGCKKASDSKIIS